MYNGYLFVTHAVKNGNCGRTTSPTIGITIDGITFYCYGNTSYKASVAGTWYAPTTYDASSSATIVTHANANKQVTVTTGAQALGLAFIPD